ncbi:hypothetical protein LCGC14_1433160 [marine sediment metagenome]|uniref:Uncharacterized protein n=1 Tax=marine sediment metagenome TaxID=412755 RepID=A0A0F9M3G3_9ZZZZ
MSPAARQAALKLLCLMSYRANWRARDGLVAGAGIPVPPVRNGRTQLDGQPFVRISLVWY